MLALVLGSVFAVRATMNNGADTEVAGTVIERSEEPSEFVETELDSESSNPVIVRPRPDREVAQEPAVREVAPPAPAPAPAAPAPAFGLVRDPNAVVVVDPDPEVAQPDPAPVRNREPRDPQPQPEPEPKPEPKPDPKPQPKPDPKPEPKPDPKPDPKPQPEPKPDLSGYMLTEGRGLSEDVARPSDDGSGTWTWNVAAVANHRSQPAELKSSREVQHRLVAGFDKNTENKHDTVQDFTCEVLLDAGSRRLITDADGWFEVSLWTSDGYNAKTEVAGSRVLLRQAGGGGFDLERNQQATVGSHVYRDLDASENVPYTCVADYIVP